MKLLLDTHVFIWWIGNAAALGEKTRLAISKAQKVFVSHASGWEFAIKKSLGKLDLSVDFETAIDSEKFEKLPIDYHHIKAISDMKNFHGDPFDRMLLAQSLVEDLLLVTADRKMLKYPAKLMDAGT
jgi:PIN domain nuclease of toxin-antitoxin system